MLSRFKNQAELITKIREANRWSKGTMAKMIGLNHRTGPQFLYRIERGEAALPLCYWKKLESYAAKVTVMRAYIEDQKSYFEDAYEGR
jgi:ribosome-binding protein aMBF1 (putative translation factor)